jgi:DNA-binding transcriptional regulator PaaX
MRLSGTSKLLLELVAHSIGDALGAITDRRRFYSSLVGYADDRDFAARWAALEHEGWIVWDDDRSDGKWVHSITKAGQEAAYDSLEPEREWGSVWDGKWRTISFDLPANARRERRQLDEWLRKRRFGRLQGSVWITHRPIDDWTEQLERRRVDPNAAIFLEGEIVGRLRPSKVASKAWNFDSINEYYRSYLEFAALDSQRVVGAVDAADWLGTESAAWNRAFKRDPFLPDALLPSGYLGKQAAKTRRKLWRRRLLEWGQTFT